MIRKAFLFIGILMIGASAGHSQTGAAKKNESGEIEMTFFNGSVVRMTLMPGEIEVATEFGKLTVPVRKIRRIEFGLHLPEGADKKISAAIKHLASSQYKEREDALRELVALGAYAYPSLVKAARSGDPESIKRAQDAIAKIKVKVSPKDLLLDEDDKIVTQRFTVVGRILTPSIKAKSEYFGDVEHSLVKLRQLRFIGESRDTEVGVDAAKYALANQWLDTGITLESFHTLAVAASGEVELRPTLPGTYIAGPRGYTRNAPGGFAGGPGGPGGGKGKKGGMDGTGRAYPGALLGRIGATGETFLIGERFESALERDGILYLQIVPSPYENASSGSYQVKVSVRE